MGDAAILLAGGLSQRMGPVNKLALDMDGISLLRRSAQTLLNAEPDQVVVVLGHEAEEMRELLEGLDVDIVINPDFEDGELSSFHAGLKAIKKNIEAVMICPADLPYLEVCDLERLTLQFEEHGRKGISLPEYEGIRTYPFMMARNIQKCLPHRLKNQDLLPLILEMTDLIETFEMMDDHLNFEITTSMDYQNVTLRLMMDQIKRPSKPKYNALNEGFI